jgi:hypothetical protein
VKRKVVDGLADDDWDNKTRGKNSHFVAGFVQEDKPVKTQKIGPTVNRTRVGRESLRA